jgi:transposase
MHRISRCQKGSNGFSRAQAHRKNYINWSIKQLNLDEVKEIGYENVVNIRKGKNTSSFMKSWTFTEIRTAVERRCEEEGVLLSEQGSIYRSQRCSGCGFVHKKNRNKKQFACIECGHHLDADLNGALNHEANLISIPFSLLSMKLNMTGFYWLEIGLFDIHGEEITVPQQQN